MPLRKLIPLFIAVFLISGCKAKKPQYLTNDPFYIKGKKYHLSGQLHKAIKSYESSLKLGKSYAAHLELAFIYDKNNNYAAIIYHCQKYLELATPKDSRTELVRKLIKQAEEAQFMHLNKDFRPQQEQKQKESKYGEVTERELMFKKKLYHALEEKEKVAQELNHLKKQLQQPGQKTKPAEQSKQVKERTVKPYQAVVVEQRPDKTDKTTTPKTEQKFKIKTIYKVKPGDNLSSISKKFYNSSHHWRLIMEANQPKLSDPSKLRVGQELKIPELP